MDRVLLVHALETSEQVGPMLKEVWRVLAGGGRLLIIAPNRRGIWARLDRTPFGSGRPYTMSQLSQLLRDELFTPVATGTALFMPPSRGRMMLRSARAWERVGVRWFPTFAGVVLVEATKQIYAKPAAVRVPKRRLVYTPAHSGDVMECGRLASKAAETAAVHYRRRAERVGAGPVAEHCGMA